MMKAKEIRELTKDQIEAKIADLKEELFNLKFQAALGNLEKPARMNEIKRTIARMKTILTEGTYALEAKKVAKKRTTKKAAEATTEAPVEVAEEAPVKKPRKTAAKKAAEAAEATTEEAPVKKTRKKAASKASE